MKLRYLKLFEFFIDENIDFNSRDLKYAFSSRLGYTEFYMEVYMKGLFLTVPCSLVKNVTDEISDELEEQGYYLSRIENRYMEPLSKEDVANYNKKLKERGYKLCKIRYVAHTDIPTDNKFKEFVCKYFAKKIMEKLAYADAENIVETKNLDTNIFERVMVSVKSGKNIEEILYW